MVRAKPGFGVMNRGYRRKVIRICNFAARMNTARHFAKVNEPSNEQYHSHESQRWKTSLWMIELAAPAAFDVGSNGGFPAEWLISGSSRDRCLISRMDNGATTSGRRKWRQPPQHQTEQSCVDLARAIMGQLPRKTLDSSYIYGKIEDIRGYVP